ncbi:MAG TPA: glutathione peroxidase [Candidatus Marinimicrobia bacterium]|jgi:glutathione peroxidase|nr:glutathione peroxidase [Candidatus Neomarinimicrobiota bacterium]
MIKILPYLLLIFAIGVGVLLITSFKAKTKNIILNTNNIAPKKSFYELEAISIDGKKISFDQYKNKKILIVNVASKCGYTYQYEGLQKLQDIYQDKVIVLGFPANDFFNQEPGSNEEIEEFCEINYGIIFQMFEKTTTKGKKQSPVYQWLTNKDFNGWNAQRPTWNFCKYLVNEKGELVGFFNSKIKPLSEEITSLL